MLEELIARTRNSYSQAITREINLSVESEFSLKDVGGLGPVKAAVSTMDSATEAGSILVNAQDGNRNIVLKVGFEPVYEIGSTVTRLRRELMQVFMPKTTVELEFDAGQMGRMFITGTVESHEPTIFSKDPGVVISIICNEPYFDGSNAVMEMIPSFDSNLNFVVPFAGEVPVGFEFEFTIAVANNAKAELRNLNLGRFIALTREFRVGDLVRFSTVRKARRVEIVRDGVVIDSLENFTGSLSQMDLQNGDNYFWFNWGGVETINPRIRYTMKYGGL